MTSIAAALSLPAVLSVSLLAQSTPPGQEPQPRTTFKSSVDLVPVDVSVVDRDGRPVDNLQATDFTLTVDGKPRRIASAEFISVSRQTETPPPPTDHSSNVGAGNGRLIMLLVDQGNIGAARGKPVIEAASAFIEQLNPADRVALHTIPGAGPQVEFTSNHLLVRQMLQNVVGQATEEHRRRKVGVAEAADLERGDERRLGEMIERECPGFLEPAEVAKCRDDLHNDARLLYQETRSRTRDTLISMRAILERMVSIPGPKTVIMVSEGVLLDRDHGDVAWLAPLAAKAQVALTVLQLDPPQFEAAAFRVSQSREADIELAQEGLSYLTGLARGTVIRVINKADFAFKRLALELSGYYLLSFEPEPGDRDGKSHKIKVSLPGRRNVELRARNEFSVDPVKTRTNEAVLTDTLRSPLLASDIGLDITTYTFREPDTQKLRVVLATEIDRSRNELEKVTIAYVLADQQGNVVASQVEPEVTTPIDAATKKQPHVGAMSISSPGTYLVKVAVLDESGRRGSVQHNFRAQLTAAGQIRVTDLLIAENTGAAAAGISPAVSANFTGQLLQGYVELYSETPEQLKNATVVMEVAGSEDSRALDSAPASYKDTPAEGPARRTAEASVPIALLPPGEYVARAVVSVSGRKIAQVSRPFRIARPAMTVTAAGAEARRAPGTEAPIPFTSRIDAFERGSVLTTPVVGFFLDRMNVGNRVAAAPAPAETAVRSGNFDAALEALKSARSDQLAPVFLTGLALYSKGDLEGAAAKFRQSLRLDSEFFPAAFYLGACYAAGGRDREAVGAWQTSLITESSAPFIYTLLADAMVRLKDYTQALDILNEATTLFPGNTDVQMRLGTALALAGRPADALKALDDYLAAHPDDHERLFVAMRVIYDVRSRGASVFTPDEDRQRFGRYAAAYAAAGGPNGPTVEQWKRFIER
jgi:VWFA-related protein